MLLLNRKLHQKLFINNCVLTINKAYTINGVRYIDVEIVTSDGRTFVYAERASHSAITINIPELVKIDILSVGALTYKLGVTAPASVKFTREEAKVKL